MKFDITVAAYERMFAKSVRGVRGEINDLERDLEKVEMVSPLYSSASIILSDSREPGTLEKVENKEGIYQVICGCSSDWKGSNLLLEIGKLVAKVIAEGKFTVPDSAAFQEVINSWGVVQSKSLK